MVSKVILANDHAGTLLKQEAAAVLTTKGLTVHNMGIDNDESVDYPDVFVHAAKELLKDKHAVGIFICGTGIGACVTANKIRSLHCALVHDSFTAKMAKEHNHCRIIALGARVVDKENLAQILEAYFNAAEQGGRHRRRVQKINAIENS